MGRQADRANDLGDRVNGRPDHVSAALPELEDILEHPEDSAALVAAIEALGLAHDPSAATVLLQHVRHDDPDSEVRLALARSLPGGVDDEAPAFVAILEALVLLSSDRRDEVRNWACFGVGLLLETSFGGRYDDEPDRSLAADTTAVRDALAARLDDTHADTRCEALVALAGLGDPRALRACRRALDASPGDAHLLELRAAVLLADPALLPSLRVLQQAWSGAEPDEFSAALAQAIARCTPKPPGDRR